MGTCDIWATHKGNYARVNYCFMIIFVVLVETNIIYVPVISFKLFLKKRGISIVFLCYSLLLDIILIRVA